MGIFSPATARDVDLVQSDDRILLRDRVRIVALVVLAVQALFALADLWLNAEIFLTLLVLKLVPSIIAVVVLIVLAGAPEHRVSTYCFLALIITSSTASAVSGIVTNDAATTPIMLLSGVLGTALLIPWGPRAHAVTVLFVTGTILLNQFAVTGTVPLNYATLGIALGLGTSIYMVYLLDRYRRMLIEKNHALENQNAELDAYARTVAHDLKNPISVIAGYTTLLEMKLEGTLDEEAREYLKETGNGCEKMTEIINALLLMAMVRKASDVKVVRLDTSRIVAEACKRVRDRIAETAAELHIPAVWPVAFGHPAWVEEVWSNYISNAIKYGGSPPRIELGAEREDNEMVRFWVRDNGDGLNADQAASLFREFGRLAPSKAEGHGLGLSIVKRIVEKLGGEVGVITARGAGSTFYFTLRSE